LRKTLAHFNELVMMSHSIFSLPFIFIAMLVAAEGWFGWELLLLGGLAAFTARNFAMAFNRYVDRDIDAQNARTAKRPSVDGRVSATAMMVFMVVNALGFVATSYAINSLAFALSIPILLVLASYSYFKRFSAMAHVVLGVTLGLAPIAGAIAVSASIPAWSAMLASGVVLWVAGFDILYSLQDVEFDTKQGLFSIPSRFGVQNALSIALAFHIMTVVLWGWFVVETNLGVWGYIAVGASAVMLGYEHALVRRDFVHINRAFFTVNGYIGIFFLFCVAMQKVVM